MNFKKAMFHFSIVLKNFLPTWNFHLVFFGKGIDRDTYGYGPIDLFGNPTTFTETILLSLDYRYRILGVSVPPSFPLREGVSVTTGNVPNCKHIDLDFRIYGKADFLKNKGAKSLPFFDSHRNFVKFENRHDRNRVLTE